MEKLVIVRTNPEQGKPVKARFEGDHGADFLLYGTGEFPFPLWLHFEKLVKDGMEARARVETRDQRRIEVEFRPTVETEATVEAKPATAEKLTQSLTPQTLRDEVEEK